MEESRRMHCADCGEPLDEEVYSGADNLPCPKCGSLNKSINLVFTDEPIQFKDSLRGKAKDPTRTGKDKLRKDFFTGDDLHRESGKWNKRERYIDKDADYYKEVVIDPESGKVIHHCEEPLSEHRDHGSAKKKNN